MEGRRYTVTVYAAAPGTTVREVDKDGRVHVSQSVPGHVYYQTSDGDKAHSWGFAPVEHGDLYGPGEPKTDDADAYLEPLYARTMEVSKDQFEKLNEFGANPDRYGFDLTYKDIRNNCVDYTWAGLNHAGIQRTHGHIGHLQPHGVDGKGSYLPIGTPNDIRTIRDPVPGSELNEEKWNKVPQREWWQAPFGTFERPLSATQDDPFDRLVAAAAVQDDKAFDKVGQDYLQSSEGQAFLEAGREHNRQQELAEQALAQQQQQQQAPAMQMTMTR